MSEQHLQQITLLLSSFPVAQDTDKKTALATYYQVLKAYPITAIEEAVMRFRDGLVDRPSHTYAPNSAEVAIEVRKVAEAQEARTRPRLVSQPFKSFDVLARLEAKRREFAHLPVIKEDVSHDEFRRMSRAREVPVGTIWVAALGTVYGPEPAHAPRAYKN